ncbi:MAG: VIT domain-containing protein [Planctomycetota bacterium]|jgi:Ca-activated chloride channel family protein
MRLTILCALFLSLTHSPGQQATHAQAWPRHLSTSLLTVKANIKDGVASTEVIQVIKNAGHRPLEATWLLPLPAGAIADHFTMTMGGKEVSGQILPPDKARHIYESIVRSRRDPGLLEYVGQGCLRARIFPIPAKGQVRVRVRYRQVLDPRDGLFEWSYPFRAARLQGRTPQRVVLDLQINSRTPIKNLYSPNPTLDLAKKGDHQARVSMELDQSSYPTQDTRVYYSVSAEKVGLDLLTYRKGNAPGYYLMMLAPQEEWPQTEHASKTVQFVIDTSGSMQGEKIQQAKAALRFFVQSLNPADKFNIIPFSTEARPFFVVPQEVNETNLAKALRLIESIAARGGTNIEDALSKALAGGYPSSTEDKGEVRIMVFLTDGQPTVGLTDPEDLLTGITNRNTNGTRIFVFGVGSQVNTKLLDKIAEQSGGDRDYVREDEDIEIKTSALLTKLSHPVLTNLRLSVDGLEISETMPNKLPDLFKGSRLLTVGRYRGHGMRAIRLRALVDGKEREFVFEGRFSERSRGHGFVPTLWAQRKIGQLLDAIRLNGPIAELVSEVQRLGREHGIVTPYTSHLILEEGLQVSQARGINRVGERQRSFDQVFGNNPDDLARISRELYQVGALPGDAPASLQGSVGRAQSESELANRKLAGLGSKTSGKDAVADSLQLGEYSRQSTPEAIRSRSDTRILSQRVSDRTFHLVDGVWVDSRYKPEMQGRENQLAAFSEEYFQLIQDQPELATYLSFSARMILVLDDRILEVQ